MKREFFKVLRSLGIGRTPSEIAEVCNNIRFAVCYYKSFSRVFTATVTSETHWITSDAITAVIWCDEETYNMKIRLIVHGKDVDIKDFSFQLDFLSISADSAGSDLARLINKKI